MNPIELFEKQQPRNTLPDFKVGDTVRVHQTITEGDKQRIQVFEGVVIAFSHGTGARQAFTVRKVSYGVGVEKVFPYNAPMIANVEVVRRGRVRRAKLYYLRKLRGKAARIKEARYKPDETKTRTRRRKKKAKKAAEKAD